jgi:hypothetical protein
MEQNDYFTQMSREDPVRYGAIMLIVFVSRCMIWVVILTFLVFLSKIVSHDSGFNKYPRRRR